MIKTVYRAYHYYMTAKNHLDIAERMLAIRDSNNEPVSRTRIATNVFVEYELNEARRQMKWASEMLDRKLEMYTKGMERLDALEHIIKRKKRGKNHEI